jgi:hypothetical protein
VNPPAKASLTMQQQEFLCDALLRLTDRCAEALATLHGDNKVDEQHFDNVLDINRELWSLRWELGLMSGWTELPAPAEETAGGVG